MNKMHKLCERNKFIHRHLCDREIYDIMLELEMSEIPEEKWVAKMTDIIYSKLKFTEYRN